MGGGVQSIYPAVTENSRDSGPGGFICRTKSRVSCGFTDRFKYNLLGCCCGKGLLLRCCFPEGEEVS